MILGKRVKITTLPGTNPIPDATESETLFYIDTDKVRFRNGKLRSVGGCQKLTYSNTQTLQGCARTIYSYLSGGKNRVMIGTNTRLYVYQEGQLFNITPFETTTTAIANSLATNYTTLGSNPVATTNGSKNIVITHTAHKLQAGDSITISGVSGTVNGVPAGELNATHTVRSVTTNTYTVLSSTTATGTGSGGGAAVIEKTALITVTAAAHGMANGDRVVIASAANTGGIPNAEINAEHIVRGVATNTFNIMCTTKATSSVSSSGGAGTTYGKQIASGECDFSQGLGYGGGLYGVGLYGVAKTFANAFSYPRIWSGGRFGDDWVGTPGDGGEIYIWENDTDEAPTLLTNAPSANWVFITKNAVVALGADSVDNRIHISDIGDGTDWTPAVDSYAYVDDIEGVGRFISQAKSKDIDLLFTENQTFILRFVDKPDIWDLRDLLASDGIIAPRARAEIEDAVFWMGGDDFYIFDGNSVDALPNNTVKEYIFGNFNYSQRWKIFCHANPEWAEVWWFYPTAESNEPNRYVIYNYREKHWTIGSWSRTAAEEPLHITQYPYLADSHEEDETGYLYRHEYGTDDDTSPLSPYAETNFFAIDEGDTTMEILEIVPDSTQTGNIDVTIYTKDKQQSTTERSFGPYTISDTTETTDVRATGRQRKYVFTQDQLGEEFIMGKWYETIREGTPR